MIRQNIKIAIIVIISFIAVWLLIFAFIKIDIGTQVIVTFEEGISKVALDTETASYIQSHNREEHIRIQYEKQYHWCSLINPEPASQYTYYTISGGPEFDISINYLYTNLFIDSLNVYQYLIKK